MDWYRYRLQPLAGTLTPWQADTLIGHFAWDIVHREGESALGDFLGAFEAGRPPFVLSDGFPGDFLPAPLTVPWLYDDPDAQRQAAGQRWLTLDEFNEVRTGRAPADLPNAPRRDPWRAAQTLHVALSRATMTSGETGSLYALEERSPADDDGAPTAVAFYALAEGEAAAERLADLLRRVSQAGYGKKKSSGKGAFRLLAAEPFDGFAALEADGLVTLANVVPAAGDPTEGLWRTAVKYGRLGEERAGWAQPFKRPFVFLAAGAVFRGPPRPWLGRPLRGLAADPDDPGRPGDDLQVCLAPVLPCAWPRSLPGA
jgi:CRISPR-associated protein Csm4